MTIIQQVEKHIIKKSHPYYAMFCGFTHQSKNLYNHANYLVRKEFLKTGKWLRYQDLDKILRQDLDYPDYTNMPAAQSAQQTLRLLDTNWKSFFKSIKDWSKNKEKYLGRPKLPKYKPKEGKLVLIVTNQGTAVSKLFSLKNLTLVGQVFLMVNFLRKISTTRREEYTEDCL